VSLYIKDERGARRKRLQVERKVRVKDDEKVARVEKRIGKDTD